MTEFLTILLFAALFVLFGLGRPGDRSAGCHSCSHGDSGGCSGDSCPLLDDAFDTKPEPDVVR